MKPFRFLRKANYLFQFEMVLNIDARYANNEIYNNIRSEVVKKWLSKYYFEKPLGSSHWEYLPEIDRVCEIMECGVVNCAAINCFDVKLKITKTPSEFVIIDLRYPLNHLIEYEI